MNNKKNVWILGGTGFIGRALVKMISRNPRYHLHLLVHKHISYKELESYNTVTGRLERFDSRWFELYPPDIIFHLARLGGSNHFARLFAARKGERANHILLKYLSELKKPPVVVYTSGSLMYGHKSGIGAIDEKTELAPISYARYYYRAEMPFLQAQKKGNRDIRFARPGWIVGPGSWFTTFYWQPYLSTGQVPVYGDGNQLMSIIDVDDCGRQIMDLAENGLRNQNLNVYSGEPISQLAFAVVMSRILGTTVRYIPLQVLQRQYGSTALEAFNASIPLKTLYPHTIRCESQQYPNIGAILNHTISLLKNHKNIFAKTPHYSTVEQLIDIP